MSASKDRHEAVMWDGRAVAGGAPVWLVVAVKKDPLTPGAVMRMKDTVHVFNSEGRLGGIVEPGDWIFRNMVTEEIFKVPKILAQREWEYRDGGFYRRDKISFTGRFTTNGSHIEEVEKKR